MYRKALQNAIQRCISNPRYLEKSAARSLAATPNATPARAFSSDSGASKTTGDSYPVPTSEKLASVYPVKPTDYENPKEDPPQILRYDIPREMIQARVKSKYAPSNEKPSIGAHSPANEIDTTKTWDVIIVGGGHNGLITANYLRDKGLDVLVLERRHTVGGAAVTEEIVPGFKFSRASYLAGLLRPQIIKDFELEKYGFEYLTRDPSSFTPTLLDSPFKGKYLLLGSDEKMTHASIAQFSERDADNYFKYDEFLGSVRDIVNVLIDLPPLDVVTAPAVEKRAALGAVAEIAQILGRSKDPMNEVVAPFYEFFMAPASQILDRWFEGDVLKATLATDSVIGAANSPRQPGSAYVLLHHVMGEAAGRKGVWAYVRGGMGTITQALAKRALERGVKIATNATVAEILYDKNPQFRGDAVNAGRASFPKEAKPYAVTGVRLADGTVLKAKRIASNATPYHTFLELLPTLSALPPNTPASSDDGLYGSSPLAKSFVDHIRFFDYSCGAFKMNLAVNKLPDFFCCPNDKSGLPGPQHRGTIHFEDKMDDIHNAYVEFSHGRPATRPVIEMTIPSALDNTLAPPGQHVVQLFVQYVPYELDKSTLGPDASWDNESFKNKYADHLLSIIDQYCKDFSSSVIGRDVLSPLDLERIFGLQRGNIMHGGLSINQIYYGRPAPGSSSYRTPLEGLYICGSGAHPGGGVMGAAGRNCANVMTTDIMGLDNTNFSVTDSMEVAKMFLKLKNLM